MKGPPRSSSRQTLGRGGLDVIGRLFDLRLNVALIFRGLEIGRAADATPRRWSYLPLVMRVFTRLARLNPLVVDGVFAVALALIAELEVGGGGAGSATLRAVVAVVMTLPLAARRRFPLPVLLLVMGAALAQSAADPDADVAGVLIVAMIAAAYSVAAHCNRRAAVVGGAAGLAALCASVHLQGGGVGNYIFAGSIFVGAWLAGFFLRARRLHSEETGRQALVEMRRLVEMLRKDDEELALAPQPSLVHLELLVQQVREAGLPVELSVEGEPRALPPGVDLSAYRIVQEALTNALKHAGPARARVTVRYAPDELELEIADDGAGSTSRTDGGGHGLVGMRERVAVFGGVLEADRRAGGGYRLRATLPLQPRTT
jgi:two-component sensor histidine kinase